MNVRYNFFLGWPIVIIGILDTDLSPATVLRAPMVYVSGRKNRNLGLNNIAGN
jgi:hypothetical protein